MGDGTRLGSYFVDKEKLPDAAGLGQSCSTKPTYFYRVDGHVVWANSAALLAAHITRETQNPAGGEIERDAQGEPTGILKETAAALLTAVVPEPTHDEKSPPSNARSPKPDATALHPSRIFTALRPTTRAATKRPDSTANFCAAIN
jgi:predicted amidohydrolase YtcJ